MMRFIIFVNWYAALTLIGCVGLYFLLGSKLMPLPPAHPVDELEVREHPRVIFRVDEGTWIDAIVRYLVGPREAGSTKTRLISKLIAALNAAPEKVMFPKGDAR